MEKINLKAQEREETGKKVKVLRKEGFIPAVLYGHGVDNLNLTVQEKEFNKVYDQAGHSALVDLKIGDDRSFKILIKKVDQDPVNASLIHADFYKIKMSEKITTEIPIEFVGQSRAVVEDEGNLITNRDNIEIECLPDDLIPSVQVDISTLNTFEDQIKVSDLKLSEGITILTELEEVIALVTPPKSDAEMEAELAADTATAEAEAVAELSKTNEGEGEGTEESKNEE